MATGKGNPTKVQAGRKAAALLRRYGSRVKDGKRVHKIPSNVIEREHKRVSDALDEAMSVPLAAPTAETPESERPRRVSFEDMQERLQDVLQGLEVLQSLKDLPESLGQLQASVDRLETRLEAVEAGQGDLTGELQAIREGAAPLQEMLESISKSLED